MGFYRYLLPRASHRSDTERSSTVFAFDVAYSFPSRHLGPVWPFSAHSTDQSAPRAAGQVLSGTQATSVAMLALLTTFGPQPRPARSTSGEPGPAAARPAFASRSYRTDRQLVRKRHAGRPGFLVSMSLHPAPPFGRGGDAGLLRTPNCQDGSADPDIPSLRQSHHLFRSRTLIGATFCFHHRPLERSHRSESEGKIPAQLLRGQPHPHWFNRLSLNRFQRS